MIIYEGVGGCFELGDTTKISLEENHDIVMIYLEENDSKNNATVFIRKAQAIEIANKIINHFSKTE